MTPGDSENAVGSLGSLRELNRRRVVEALVRAGTASRSDLARLTGLSRTTVATVVADLQTRGLVREGQDEQGASGRGRPPTMLALDPSAGAAIGIDFGHRHVAVAVADLASTVLAEEIVELDVDHGATAALDTAVALVDRVLAESGVDRARIVGAGMALPGPIDRGKGTVASTTILPAWDGLHAAQELANRLGIRVEADNDANIGARAEHAFGAGRGLDDFVFVQLRAGIGGALVLGGRLHYGATGIAGELGHVPVQAGGVVCRCGNRGCLETVASAEALVAALRPSRGPALTVADLIELVRTGDVAATRLVADAGRAVGRVLADLCNNVNPAAVVVGGDLAAAGPPLLEGIRSAIDRFALPAAAEAVEIKAGVLGERAEVLGALALVLGDPASLRSAGLVALGHDRTAVAR